MKNTDAPLAPGLYLVATPIGNLEDITLRALRVLANVDRIACEDTRQTQKLLDHFDIRKPTVSYHAHNEGERADELLTALREGARIAVVSDAGTPGISDPGSQIAAHAAAAGIAVYPIPGANAAVSALIASGLNTEQFRFYGFLPSKEGARRTMLEDALRHAKSDGGPTRIFYETPHRIVETLAEVEAVFGPQHLIALARELTKLHEEFIRGTVGEVRANIAARPSIRGEMVLMLDGAAPAAGSQTLTVAQDVAERMRSGLTEKEALKQVAKERGLGKSEAYRELQRTKP